MPPIRLFLVLLLGFALAVGGAAATGDWGLASEDIEAEADRMVIEVSVDEAGDATWQIQYRIRMASDADREAFEDLESDIADDPEAYEERYQARMARAVEAAENATAREMSMSSVQISTGTQELPEQYGVIVYEFEWRGFAERQNGALLVGDAIDGFFLDEGTTLLIGWPEGWTATDVSPSPDREGSHVHEWRGPVDFGSGEPRVTATQPGLLAWHHAMYAVLLLIGASGIAGLWFGYRRGWLSVAGREADEDAPSSDIAEADLLSNEEQVLQLIEANGGRMKQKRVAEELDWTAAKTSQVTSGLRESGDLEGFRLGRENVLRLPDVDPEDPTE